jgi:hypothetical protein
MGIPLECADKVLPDPLFFSYIAVLVAYLDGVSFALSGARVFLG